MKLLALALSLAAITLGACVTSSNLCPTGFEYATQYDACVAVDAGGSADAGSTSAAITAPEAGAPDDADPGDGAAGDGSSGLGDSCNSSSDCTGAATYCLKSPLSPSDPGICTFTDCTQAECTSAYSCCDCTAASFAPLQAYPKGICAPSADESQLTAFGCTCQ